MIRKKQKPLSWQGQLRTRLTNKRIVLGALISIAVIIVVIQLAYPYDRGTWFSTLSGQSTRLMTHDEMAKLIAEKFAETKVKVTVEPIKSIEFDLRSTGAEPNTEAMITQLSSYPLWQRFIPGSFLWQQSSVRAADVYYTGEPFKEFIAQQVKELNFAPQNARLAIKDGQLVAEEAVEGSELKSQDLLDTIAVAEIALGGMTVLPAPAKRIKAERYSLDLQDIRREAEAALAHTVTIQAPLKNYSPSKEQLASWILLDDSRGKVVLNIDKERVKTYLQEINKEVGLSAGQTNITIVDGRETGRVTGPSGTALDSERMADQIAQGILASAPAIVVNAQFVEVQPSVIFNNKYTATQAGLQAYVNDVARTKDIRISIKQVNGTQWSASARGDESTPSGSTYKLYIALVLFDRMNKGDIRWGDPMLDTTVSGCFDRMTIASTNPCAEAWIAQFGRKYLNDFIYERGFSNGTTFTATDAARTTANDLTKYMVGLNDGTLVSGEYRDRLLSSLGRHPYRMGIPAGSRGVVNDKVGFLWDYIHDTAIVNHPKGTYVMTVMTKGYSYGTIATITREVERIMYP